jgi:drug/metabolite transporter (DMT)-like permease
MAFAWLFVSILFLHERRLSQIANLTRKGWAGILSWGAGSGIAYIFWYDALQVLSVAQTGAFVYLELFITVIVAAIVLAIN